MADPSLRELLLHVGKSKDLNLDLYILLKALVEAVEPDDTPTDEEYNDARDARIRFLQERLAEAKAEIERLRKECDILRGTRARAVDARVRARRERNEAMLRLQDVRAELASYTASVNADAEVGQLVRGMALGTRLERTADQVIAPRAGFWGYHCVENKWRFVKGAWDDPAEALRAIQKEVDDA